MNAVYMKKLAKKIDLVFDGDDDRLHADDNRRIDVFAQDMSKKRYNEMEKDINSFKIKGEGYTIYAWNDCSGFNYWQKSSPYDSNYIQISATIENDEVDPIKLNDDMEKAYNHFCVYDNRDNHIFE